MPFVRLVVLNWNGADHLAACLDALAALDWPADRLPATPSYEFSGIVAEVGRGVDDVAAGREVFALSGFDRDGAAAEYILVPLDVLAPKPVSLGHVQSASLPLAGLSAWQGLFDHGRPAKASGCSSTERPAGWAA